MCLTGEVLHSSAAADMSSLLEHLEKDEWMHLTSQAVGDASRAGKYQTASWEAGDWHSPLMKLKFSRFASPADP